DDISWAKAMNLFQRGKYIVFFSQLVRFTVVQDKGVEPFQKLEQILQSDVQPKVHGVGSDEFGALHLVEDMMLQARSNICQEDKGGVLMGLRQSGSKRFKHPQFSNEGAPIVHVQFVLSGPMKGFAGQNLQAFEIDAMAFVKLQIALGKIVTNDADEIDRAKKARGHCGVAGRTA